MQVVGRLSSYKKIPLLTGLGDVINGKRKSYDTLIRVSYDLRDEAKAILAFLSHLKWFHFGLIYRYADVYYDTLAEQLLTLLSDSKYSNDFVCTCKWTYVRDENRTILTDLQKIISSIKQCARSKINTKSFKHFSLWHFHFLLFLINFSV